MRIVTAQEACNGFLQLLAEVEQGETVLIARDGKTIAELRPYVGVQRDDAEWRAAYDRMFALMNDTPATGCRVGEITESDKYSDLTP
jgi:antitoxin (DNA-binding transcriptional repressor) of toxin-antitoxin stability system